MRILALALGLAALLATGATVQAAKRQADATAQIDRIANIALQQSHVAGFSVAIARDGQTIFAKGYGHADGDMPVDADTVYHIDSVTKNFTAAAILLLAEQGKLSLDDPLSKYVSELPLKGRDVRVRNLLNHTSGIKSYTSLPNWDDLAAKKISSADIVSLIAKQPFDFAPGESWRYSNSGFYLAGLVIERASHETYADFLRKHLFAKLGMTSTSFGCPGVAGHELSRHKLVAAEPIDWSTTFSAGGLCSSVHDLLTWEQALRSGRVISRKSLAAMIAPTHLSDSTVIDYGLGTRLGTLAGHPVNGHTGSGGGFGAILEYYPSDKVAVAILTNTGDSLALPALAAQLARKVLGLPDAVLDEGRTLTLAEIQRYSGTYDSDEGSVEVFSDRGTLAMQLPDTKQILAAFSYQGHDRFESAPDDQAVFLGKGKQADWMLHYVGLMMDAKRRVK